MAGIIYGYMKQTNRPHYKLAQGTYISLGSLGGFFEI